MSSNPRSLGSGSVSTLEVLRQLGFAEDQSQQQRGLRCDFGSFTLWALHCTNKWFVPVVMVTGTLFNGRQIREVVEELPGQQEQTGDVEQRVGDERAEEEYERRTEGVPAEQAAAVAVEMSDDRRNEENRPPGSTD
jgi:hypothetical protein